MDMHFGEQLEVEVVVEKHIYYCGYFGRYATHSYFFTGFLNAA